MKSVFHILNPSEGQASWVNATTGGTVDMAPWARVAREHPQHTETLLDWALKEGATRLVVWGGDGTFHRVVRGLWRRNALPRVELALVPSGTCNDLARRLNLSKYFWRRWEAPSPEGQLASLAIGRIRARRHVAAETAGPASGETVEEDIFVNNAGFGRPRASFERRDGSWGVLKAFQSIRLTARWADGHLQGLYYMVLACNAPYFSGGLCFEKSVSPTEGLLRVYFVPVASKARLALRLLRGKLGWPLFDGKTTKLSVSRLAIDTETPVWPQADGEDPPEEGARHVEFDLLPERLRLWCPKNF